MPRYKSRRKSVVERERKRVRAAMPRDKRHLMHWAVRGSHDDFAKFRKHAAAHAERAPSYIEPGVMQQLSETTRPRMLKSIQHEPWGGGWFSDGLAWLIDQVPDIGGWKWAKGLGQAALKPFRGDSLSETDQQYARLTDQSYKLYEGSAPDEYEHWRRQPEFDSNYVSVWDNEDGHRFISVRGTKPNVQDIKEDAWIAATGKPDNLIGEDLRKILDNTAPDKTVDLGAHSLGTSLALTAYEADPTLQNRIHESYMYSPAFTPFTGNITDKYEADDRVRYFIDLSDIVSIGDLGSKGPSNVVYRNNWNPLTGHSLTQWGGKGGWSWETDIKEDAAPIQKEDDFVDADNDGVPDDAMVVGDDYQLDFGEGFDSGAWRVYFNT